MYHPKSRTSRYLGYAGSAVSTASKALAVAYGIKKLLNVEFKFHDVQETSTVITETPLIIQLTNVPQGDTDQTRDGAQIKLTRITIKYVLESNATSERNIVRCILVLDKQTNQAIYTIEDILSDVSNRDILVSGLNLDNKFRFSILYNKVHAISLNSPSAFFYREFTKELDMKIRFDNSTPSIADLTSYSLSWIIVGLAQANGAALTFFSRIRYVDN